MQSLHIPLGTGTSTPPAKAVVKAKLPVRPKLDLDRSYAITTPKRRPRRVCALGRRDFGDLGQKCSTRRQWLRLIRRPSPQTTLQGTRLVVGVSLRPFDLD